MNSNQERPQGLGGALYAVYGTASDMREVRIFRSPAPFLAAALRKAKDLFGNANGRKPPSRDAAIS